MGKHHPSYAAMKAAMEDDMSETKGVTVQCVPEYTDEQLRDWMSESDRSRIPVPGLIITIMCERARFKESIARLTRLRDAAKGALHYRCACSTCEHLRDAIAESEQP